MYGSIGKLGITSQRCATNQAIAFCKPRNDIMELRWLFYYLMLRRSHLISLGKGGTQQNISQSVLLKEYVPVPPLETQRRIVARIDELFSELDDGETALAHAREDLEIYRKALLKAAVTGELTADWRAANPPKETGEQLLQRILAERRARWEADPKNKGKRYKEPAAPDTSDLPELPEGWVWMGLDQACWHITSGSRAWSKYYDRGNCVFVMAQNVRPGRYDDRMVQLIDPPEDDPERHRTQIMRGDLLLTIVGANTGDLCRVNFDAANHFVCQSVALLRPSNDHLGRMAEIFFSGSYGRELKMEKLIYGAGRPHLSFEQIKSLAFPLPPTEEVPQILSALSPLLSETDQLGHTINETESLTTLRQSILVAAFKGELVQ